MKNTGTIIMYLVILFLCGAVVYTVWQNHELKRLAKQNKIASEASVEYWKRMAKNDALKEDIAVSKAEKKEFEKQRQVISDSFKRLQQVIAQAPDSAQDYIRKGLISEYRSVGQTVTQDTGRQVNAGLTKGLEAIAKVPVLLDELATDSSTIADQNSLIENHEKTIADQAAVEAKARSDLAEKDEKLKTETKRKKRWRKIALLEGAGIGAVIGLIILL